MTTKAVNRMENVKSNNLKRILSGDHVARLMIRPSTPIIKTIQAIDSGGVQIVFVINGKKQLLGTVTDGDIRRGILKGISLESPVMKVMNRKPFFVCSDDLRETIEGTPKIVRQVPIVDSTRRVIGVEIRDEFIEQEGQPNWVVLMVGGHGQRLRPLTDDCPKPLLKVGSRPLLETIIRSFIEFGFRKFYLAGHYRLDMLKKHFGNGDKFGATIRYVHEKKRLGTAGALGLLPDVPKEPFFVMNGDLLTKINFQQLLDFHKSAGVYATMCVTEYDLAIPYGVVKIKNGHAVGIDEKPVQRVFINAGIYVLDPRVLPLVSKNSYCDMPELLEKLKQAHFQTSVFPIREYWMDIGRLPDYEKANGEFAEIFK